MIPALPSGKVCVLPLCPRTKENAKQKWLTPSIHGKTCYHTGLQLKTNVALLQYWDRERKQDKSRVSNLKLSLSCLTPKRGAAPPHTGWPSSRRKGGVMEPCVDTFMCSLCDNDNQIICILQSLYIDNDTLWMLSHSLVQNLPNLSCFLC